MQFCRGFDLTARVSYGPPTSRAMPIQVPMLLPVLAYLLFGHFYIFPSGLPQPGDALFLLALGGVMLFGGAGICLRRDEAIPILALGLWTALVNLAFFVGIGDPVFLKKASFWAYNLCVFAAALSLFRQAGEAALRWVVIAAFFALLLQCATIFLVPEFLGKRQLGSFNNPNQLAYWTLINLSILIVAACRLKAVGLPIPGGRGLILIAYLLTGWIVMESLSKAGLAACMILTLLTAPRTLSLQLFPIAATAVGLAAALILMGPSLMDARGVAVQFGPMGKVIERLESSQQDETLTSRGYFRLLDRPEYLITGAGEGALWRLSSKAGKVAEIHSTPMQFLTSYGLVGTGLLLWFGTALLGRADRIAVAVLLALLIYGLAHNGLRFTHVWVLLALIAAAPSRPRSYAKDAG